MARKVKAKVNPQQQGGGGDKMKFTTLERIKLSAIVAQVQADFTTLAIIRKLQADLSFTEAEHKALELGPSCSACGGIRQSHGAMTGHSFSAAPGTLAWRTDADKGVDIEVGPVAREAIKGVFTAINEAKKGTPEQLALYERFFGPVALPESAE